MTTHTIMRMPATSGTPNSHVPQVIELSLCGTFTVAGASTVAGVAETFVAAIGGTTLFEGDVAAGTLAAVTGGAALFEGDVARTFDGLCCTTGTGAFCSGSGGSGARVSDGNAFEATGVSTLGEVSGAATGFSFLTSACEAGGDCVAFAVVASMPGTVAACFCAAV